MHSSTRSQRNTIEAHGLTKSYGEVQALAGVDLTIDQGSVLGLLGPNGAGKTTIVSILTTLIRPDSGSARVCGIDVLTDPVTVRRRIGLSGQYAAVDEHLSGFENLDLIGRLYHLGRRNARRRAHELLERFSLAEAGARPVKTYSGGMRRRLDLAGALVAQPPVLVLDEPTTGLDPRSRTELWDVIREMVEAGTTLLLTTQYMEEAEQLANEVVVIDHGKKIAEGSVDTLKTMVGGERIDVALNGEGSVEETRRVLARFAVGEVQVSGRELTAPVSGGAGTLTQVLRYLDAEGVSLRDVGLRRPTLDDVFLSLTGHTTTAGVARSDVVMEEVA